MDSINMRESLSKVQDSQGCCDKARRHLEEAGTRVLEAKRRADETHEQVNAQTERYKRLSAVYASTEENLNGGLTHFGELIRDTAGATHSLSCGTTDRDCNEARYLRVALGLLERLHKRSEITFVERFGERM